MNVRLNIAYSARPFRCDVYAGSQERYRAAARISSLCQTSSDHGMDLASWKAMVPFVTADSYAECVVWGRTMGEDGSCRKSVTTSLESR
jgi:hypothetical protein